MHQDGPAPSCVERTAGDGEARLLEGAKRGGVVGVGIDANCRRAEGEQPVYLLPDEPRSVVGALAWPARQCRRPCRAIQAGGMRGSPSIPLSMESRTGWSSTSEASIPEAPGSASLKPLRSRRRTGKSRAHAKRVRRGARCRDVTRPGRAVQSSEAFQILPPRPHSLIGVVPPKAKIKNKTALRLAACLN